MKTAIAGPAKDVRDQVLREAEKLRARVAPGFGRAEIAEVLEEALVNKGHLVRRMVWIPERCASLRLNCGYLVDLLVDGHTALFVETDPLAAMKTRANISRCLAAGSYQDGLLLHFGDELMTHAVAATGTQDASH